MPYNLEDRLVIGVASSALFDLRESDAVFQSQGEEAYRIYQEEHIDDHLSPGIAFPFIEKLLSLNDLSTKPDDPLVEVIVLSRNDPDTGLRVMRSIQHHNLDITRAVFMQGKSPYKFIPAFSMSLFLSGSDRDIRKAVQAGHPAGRVFGTPATEKDESGELRIAFDFDCVLADDSSERVMQEGTLEDFHQNEVSRVTEPIQPGPLHNLLSGINRIQKREEERKLNDPSYELRIHVALVTARNAPSHERAVMSLKAWGLTVNDAFFLGGVDKGKIIEVLKPHIFFDDQEGHIASTSIVAPSVHVPFGVTNNANTPGTSLTLEQDPVKV